jgi:hypothetical protein
MCRQRYRSRTREQRPPREHDGRGRAFKESVIVFDRIAERLIREAMSQGRFDNLPNAGQPIDFEDYFKAPEEMRAAYALLKGAHLLPEEASLLKDIERLEAELARMSGGEAAAAVDRAVQDARLRLGLCREANRAR